MLMTNPGHTGTAPADLRQLGGLFGTIPASDMAVCLNTNTALTGWSKLTPDSASHPNAAAGYGLLQTLDTTGAGANGRARIAAGGIMQQWVFQQAMLTDGSLYTRQRINEQNWTAWVKRW